MKSIFLTFAIVLSTLLFGFSQKTAHLNFNELVQAMPESIKAIDSLQSITKAYQSQLDKLSSEFKTKSEAFEKEKDKLQPAIKDFRTKELNDLQQNFDKFKQAAQEDLNKKRESIYSPVIAKAKAAVEAVAKEKGYGYVIDSSTNTYVYLNSADNIQEIVKKKLGIK